MQPVSHLFERVPSRLRASASKPWFVSGLLGVLLAGGILALARRPGREAYEPLLNGNQTLSPREIARMTTAFRKAGLPESQVTGGRVLVPAVRREAYLAALETASALPAEFDESLERHVAKANPFASHQQNEQSFRYAIQMKLARIVSGMQGIETASVQYDEVKQPGFPPTTEKRALVAVRPLGDQPLEYERIEAIRDTVAGSIGGLERTHVTVTDLAAGRAYPGGSGPPSATLAAQLRTAAQAALEKDFRQKIEQRLAKYQDLVVGVSVHFGAPVNVGDRTTPGGTAESFTPALVTASIDVPKSYFRKVWRDRNPQAAQAVPQPRAVQAIETEIRKSIQQAVAAMLPPPPTNYQSVPQVTVTSYDDLPADEGPLTPATLAATALRHGPLVAGAAVCLIGLLLLRGRKERPSRAGSAQVEDDEAAMLAAPSHLEVVNTAPPSMAAPPPSSHPELFRVIQEDSAAAARVLNQWIAEAA
jgi:flagellar biosynthesis/type III secretory pathway M-ring protein FliF/YscJ